MDEKGQILTSKLNLVYNNDMGRFKTSSGSVFDGLEKDLVHENLCDVEMWQMWFV